MEATRLSMSLMIKVFSYPFVRRSFIISLSHFYFISNHFGFNFKSVLLLLQTWILGPDIGKRPAKNWVMSDKSCFTTGTVVRHEVKFFFINCWHLKTQKHLVSIGLSCSFYEHFNRHFYLYSFFNIQDRMIC